MTIQGLGRFGVWRQYAGVAPEDAGALEGLGYSALWLGGSPAAELPVVESLLEATDTLIVGTSIVNVWSAPAKETAESFHRIDGRFPGRFVLGIGAGHREINDAVYRKPYDALVDYLDVLDDGGVPQRQRALAALGPRVLKLARDRTAGALPYLTTPGPPVRLATFSVPMRCWWPSIRSFWTPIRSLPVPSAAPASSTTSTCRTT